MNVTRFIPDGPKLGVNVKNNDFQDVNGIWHCGKCGRPKQKRIDTELFHKTVWTSNLGIIFDISEIT